MICRVRQKSVSKKKRAPCFKVSQRMKKSFEKLVNYCTYRVKNESQLCNSQIAVKFTKMFKMLKSQLKKTDLDEMGSISIFAFLREFRDECESIGIYKDTAMWLVSCFLTKPASTSLEARLWPSEIRATGLHDKR